MISSISRVETYISEAVFFALYIFFCLALLKPRTSAIVRKLRVPVYAAVILCSCGAAAALALGGKEMAALTLLPLIAYLPFSICAYVLSECGILEALAAFSIAALAAVTASRVRMVFLLTTNFIPDNISAVIMIVVVLLLAVGGGDVALRHIRKPFRICMNLAERRHLSLLLPAAAFFLMIFLNFNRTDSDIAVLITAITAMAFFIIASRLLIYTARVAEANAREKLLAESLEQQKKGFENLLQSADAGRFYRHDMRHHLNVLSGMARRNNSNEIVEYIEALNISSESSAAERLCKNPALNAMLSDYKSRAEKLGCRVKFSVSVPEEPPFELPDICVILANALENALCACEKCDEDKRSIDLLAEYSDDSKLKISVKNSCAEAVELDEEGLPVVANRGDGHGIGLRSVKKTVEKYDGFICCAYNDEGNGEFQFCAEIFRAPEAAQKTDAANDRAGKRSKALPAVLALVISALGIVNFTPDSAAALSDVFSVKLKTLSYGWGDNSLNVKYPEFSGEDAAVPNAAVRDFVAEAQDIFREYALQKYEGNVALDAGYRIYINDRTLLSARFFGTINAGGSADFSRCVVMDKISGVQLSLGDLFAEDFDYIAEISAEVLRQMERRVEFGANYFIPGGIWDDSECFKQISPEQEFYIDANGQLIIVFDEYTVAPGSEGAPEFIMPAELFAL